MVIRMNKYNRLIRFLMTICMVMITAGIFVPAPVAAKEINRETITVGVPVDRCPVFYQDKDTGELVGIGVDLMRIAAKEAGFNVTFRTIKEVTLKDALDNSAYDIVMPFGSAIPSTSGQPTLVSDNLNRTPFVLVTDRTRELPPFEDIRVGMLRSLGGVAETIKNFTPV